MGEREPKNTTDRQRQRTEEGKKRQARRAGRARQSPQSVSPAPLAPLLRYASEHPEASALQPVVARQLLALQASHGNQYVQALVKGTLGAARDAREPGKTDQASKKQGVTRDPREPFARVTVDEAKRMMNSGDAVQVVDVREPREFGASHLGGSTSIPLGSLVSRSAELARDRNIAFVCQGGQRSAQACETAAAVGLKPDNLLNVEGGTEAWAKAGLPLERAGPIPPSECPCHEAQDKKRKAELAPAEESENKVQGAAPLLEEGDAISATTPVAAGLAARAVSPPSTGAPPRPAFGPAQLRYPVGGSPNLEGEEEPAGTVPAPSRLLLVARQLWTSAESPPRALFIQRTIGDGHDLRSPRFARDSVLEAVYDGERLLKRGHRGPAVQRVQKALVDAGCPLLRFGVDGVFGGETQRAVMCFQRASGLAGGDVDGIVGPITMSRLDARFGGPPGPGGRGGGGGGGGGGGRGDKVCGLPEEDSEGEGGRLVRGPHQGDATIVCDGDGDYRADLRSYALAPCGYNHCVRLHEGVHCEDWRERWPRGCMKADGVRPRPDGAKVPTGKPPPGYNEFLKRSECRAWEMTRMCVASIIPGSSEKCKKILEQRLRDAEKMKETYCGS